MSQQCPLCGNIKPDNALFCDKCESKIENEYEIDIAENNTDVPIIEQPQEPLEESERKPKEEVTENNGKSKGIKAAITISSLIVLSVIGFFVFKDVVIKGNKDKSLWNEVTKENTIAAYLEYMTSFPKGKNYNEAENAIMNLKRGESDVWQQLQVSDNSAELRDFLETNPQTSYKPLIKKRLDSLSWSATMKDNTRESYKNYLDQSTNGDFDGYYMNQAKERLYLLTQRYPVVTSELDSIKMAVDGFFVALSDINASSLEKHLAPKVFKFYNIGSGTKEKIVGDLLISGSKKQSPTIKFIPDISSITYEKTLIEHYKVNVALLKTTTNPNGTEVNRYGYIEKIELDSNFQILSIEELRPN